MDSKKKPRSAVRATQIHTVMDSESADLGFLESLYQKPYQDGSWM